MSGQLYIDYFNPIGKDGRMCPRCYREDALRPCPTDAKLIECLGSHDVGKGCAAVFRRRDDGTLERIRNYTSQVVVCECGAKHFGFSSRCGSCEAIYQSEQRYYARGYR